MHLLSVHCEIHFHLPEEQVSEDLISFLIFEFFWSTVFGIWSVSVHADQQFLLWQGLWLYVPPVLIMKPMRLQLGFFQMLLYLLLILTGQTYSYHLCSVLSVVLHLSIKYKLLLWTRAWFNIYHLTLFCDLFSHSLKCIIIALSF